MSVVEQQLEMNFEDAFKQFAIPDKPEAETPVDEPAEAPVEAAEAPAEAVEAPSEPAEAPSEPVEAPAEAPKAEAKPTEQDDELLRRLSALVKEAPAPKPEPEPAPAPAAEVEILTADEKEFLSNYEKDWPDVAKAEQLRRRAEYQQLVGYVFAEVAKEMRPLVDVVRTLSERTHLSDLHTVAPDYDDVRDKVIDWVGKQPTYLQTAYQHVIDQGTPEEVADLIRRYKQETAPAAPAAAPRKAETELPTATRQAAQSLAPVSSKRSAIPQAADPNDFEAAFASFASKL